MKTTDIWRLGRKNYKVHIPARDVDAIAYHIGDFGGAYLVVSEEVIKRIAEYAIAEGMIESPKVA